MSLVVGGLSVDPKEARRLLEQQEREEAMERAVSRGLNAYPVTGWQGFFAVPSGSRLGWVYMTKLGWVTGQPEFCTCEARIRWCSHAGAARRWWDDYKEAEDAERQANAEHEITEMKEHRKHGN